MPALRCCSEERGDEPHALVRLSSEERGDEPHALVRLSSEERGDEPHALVLAPANDADGPPSGGPGVNGGTPPRFQTERGWI